MEIGLLKIVLQQLGNLRCPKTSRRVAMQTTHKWGENSDSFHVESCW